MTEYTYKEIANNFDLWQEYVDPSNTMTEEDFDTMTEEEKIQHQAKAFGKEYDCGEENCEYRTNDQQDLDEHRKEHEFEKKFQARN